MVTGIHPALAPDHLGLPAVDGCGDVVAVVTTSAARPHGCSVRTRGGVRGG